MTTCLIHIRISSQMQERATRRRPFQDSVSISHEGYVENCPIVSREDVIINPIAFHKMTIQEDLRMMSNGK